MSKRLQNKVVLITGGSTGIGAAAVRVFAAEGARVVIADRAADAGTALAAEIEAGAFGPEIEEALAAQGLALGHHPDSFVYSTLGGWIATRSAGSHSNAYGKIEDMLVAVRMVTPTGVLETRLFAAASGAPAPFRFARVPAPFDKDAGTRFSLPLPPLESSE